MVQSKVFRLVAVLVPALGVLVGLPLALTPFEGDPRGIFGPYFLTALPVFAAMAAAPGYLICLFDAVGARASSRPRRWWIRVSLLVALAASIAGLWGATRMFLFGPPALVALLCVVLLWVRFERAPGASPPAAGRAAAGRPPGGADRL